MKQGDYSTLAKSYIHRAGYSLNVLKALYRYANLSPEHTMTADIGAGTGKLTENLIELGFKGFAVEPNDTMREEGIRLIGNSHFLWSKGKGECTGLPAKSVDWVLMGSSFHWTQRERALAEFHRILKPGGFFVAIWNPRDLTSNPFHQEIEEEIYRRVPQLQRVSSGASPYMKDLDQILLKDGLFKNLIFMEAPHQTLMSKERYLGAWHSVNDIRAQAGEDKFQQILEYIESKIGNKSTIIVPYKTRAWMVQASIT